MSRRSSQLRFESPVFRKAQPFGGSLLKKSNAKTARPISTRAPMHIVLRSTQARGKSSMRASRNYGRVDKLVNRHAERFGVRMIRYANVGNHLHLLVKVKNRFVLAPFLRALSGALAMLLTGARKGQKLATKFWDSRPFSRIVYGRTGYRIVDDYIELNEMEGAGVVGLRKGIGLIAMGRAGPVVRV